MLIKRDFLFILPFAGLWLSAGVTGADPVALVGDFGGQYPLLSAFVKFALLGTLGEVIGVRISSGAYPSRGFGLLPRAVIWGLLGVLIKVAFVVFAAGVPALLASHGMADAAALLGGPLSVGKLLVAFSISLAMNLIFSPLLMTLHKITDTHIQHHHGRAVCLLRPIAVGRILQTIDWRGMWFFVFKKTIPLFWVPAHTLTFLLPPEYRVLFAAFLGVALGIILVLPARGSAASVGVAQPALERVL